MAGGIRPIFRALRAVGNAARRFSTVRSVARAENALFPVRMPADDSCRWPEFFTKVLKYVRKMYATGQLFSYYRALVEKQVL
jgi:hypothetical protein